MAAPTKLRRVVAVLAFAGAAIPALVCAQDGGLTNAADQLTVESPSPPPAPVTLTIAAPEARQGVASDGTHVFAINNDQIGKYEIATGRRVDGWQGSRAQFPHMNSCTVVGEELICAASNYPQVPHTSAVEIFSTSPVAHLRTVSLGFGPGSLTVMDRHKDSWWGVFANYSRRGGVPERGHEYTMLTRMDDQFRILESWAFPPEVLARMAPYSCSGLSWGEDGLIYATGHDRPEVYVLTLPEAGSTLKLIVVLGTANDGQAIDWDPAVPDRLWSISRTGGEMIASQIDRPNR